MPNIKFNEKQSFILRLAVGLIFGLIIAWIIETTDKSLSSPNETEIWRQVLSGTLALSAFILWAGLGAMRRISLGIWFALSAAIIAFILHHSITHGSDHGLDNIFSSVTFLIFPFLFIAHELVSSGDIAGKFIAPYETYFEEAWKRGVQLALSIAFTIIFWAILWLGAALLGFIGIDWFKDLLGEEFFAIPATGVAFASAVHLGDVQPKLLSNFRNLILSIFSWLLPLIVLVGGLFVVSLTFTGLQPLWDTNAGTATLLWGCVILVLLINAAYGQGENESKINKILKLSIRAATAILLIFAILAAYGLGLRINQYGLTPERVFALIGVIIACSYGVLYMIANFMRGPFMNWLERANINLAFIKAFVFLMVLTPIGDPSRLSVSSQVAMLNSGKLAIDKFDWNFLRFRSGKYGTDALDRLATSANANIKAKAIATKTIAEEDRYVEPANQTPEDMQKPDASRFKVIKGGAIPASFFNQKFDNNDFLIPSCLHKDYRGAECEVALIDLNSDKIDEIIISTPPQIGFFALENGAWKYHSATPNAPMSQDMLEKWAKGEIHTQKPKWDDLVVGNAVIDLGQ